MELLHNPTNWVLISTVAFLTFAFFKARQPLFRFLDARSAKIKEMIDEAARLRAEAEAFLKESRKQQQDAATLAQKIVRQAQDTAAQIERDSEAKLKEDLARKEKQLIDRIARAETTAIENVRQKAAEIATQTAEHILQDALAKNGRKLVDDSIAHIPGALKN